jgi:hypothetical protein
VTPTTVIFLYMLVAFFCGLLVARGFGRAFGFDFQNHGEAAVARAIQANFAAPDYHLFNHVTLRMAGATTQIDHILVSRFGVFVIETKDYKGWIFASEKQKEWTQVLFRAKFRFQNPLLQNFRHVCAVRDLLDFLPPDAVRSIVVFTGSAEFKAGIPANVFNLPGMVEHLRLQRRELMSSNRMHFCVGRLETERLAISRETDIQHLRTLERRYGSKN